MNRKVLDDILASVSYLLIGMVMTTVLLFVNGLVWPGIVGVLSLLAALFRLYTAYQEMKDTAER